MMVVILRTSEGVINNTVVSEEDTQNSKACIYFGSQSQKSFAMICES